ncbi:multidrug effflux MFS transporter [Candidatus Tisiphia endosymbiont of Oplodontha viridula]|uniref:multidrug effflux MFS transporter n=1 Tax=Candidatus Tisiphia endosymbiont of Oplodontha viridula TaxID=3077925 RepID=UPI0035C88E20
MNLFIAIIIMEILAGAEVDLFVPSFPDLQDTFNLSTFKVEFLLGINLIAHCVTALIVGNLGDRFGRRVIILIGLVIFVVGSIFCLFAIDYYMMLFGRFLQGAGISGVAVLAYVVLADAYSVKQQQQMAGTINGIITLAMAFAPVIGSYVNFLLSWQGNFAILLILGFLCLIIGILFIPKGQANDNIKISLREYSVVFKSKKTIYYLITLIFMVQAYWVFIGISPILYMQDIGVPIQQFGLYQGTLAAIFSVISFSNSYLLRNFGQKKCFFFSISVLVAFIIVAIVMIILKINDPLIITIVVQLVAVGMIFPCNILWPLALDSMPNAKGRITAILVSGRLIITALCLQLVCYFYHGNFTSLAIVMCITIVIALIFCYKLLQEDKIFNKSEL